MLQPNDYSMIMGYGHDDRVCAYPSFAAMLEIEKPQHSMSTQRIFPLMIPVIPFRQLWTQLWCKRKEASLWVGWQRRVRLWRLGSL